MRAYYLGGAHLPYPVWRHPVGVKINAKLAAGALRIFFGADTFINFICRGSSGMHLATILAARFKNSGISYVRRDHTRNHSTHFIDHTNNIPSDAVHVIVDDFIDSGNTLEEILKALQHTKFNWKISCVAMLGSESNGDDAADCFDRVGYELPKYYISVSK